jgi:predicted nucleic acid-binding protein
MKAKVYLETSIVSYYSSRPSRDIITTARQQVTREWWEEYRGKFDTYISALVLEEAKGGDPDAAKKRLTALEGIPILEISNEAEELATAFVKFGPIPEVHSEDALHIALAVINGMDFLVTWNFHHINNAKMKKEIIRIAEENGYECPVICSPEELEGT